MSRKNKYLSNIRGAEAFINMDRNLLRFPEVVLERIQMKMEDGPSSSAEKSQDTKSPRPQQNGELSPYGRGGSAGRRSRGWSGGRSRGRGCRKNCRRDSVRAGHRLGYDGSMNEVERARGPRRGGKKRRGGWPHFGFHDRQQIQRKLKRRATFVEDERQRGQRFSEEENEVLVDNILTHYTELCGPSAIKGNPTQKRRLWQEVADQVNGVASTYRSMEVCKKRYGDCRRTVRTKMAALERQTLGRGDPQEQIRFNSWEEKLRRRICAPAPGGSRWALESCEPTMLETAGSNPPEPTNSVLCPSWTPTAATAAYSYSQAPPTSEMMSEGEEATSPLEVQILSEWSEEEPPAEQVDQEKAEPDEAPPPEPHVSPVVESGRQMEAPESYYTTQQLPEEYTPNLLSQVSTSELHKLRENVVEGQGRVVQQLEGLASEVRELNTHVRQIHLNQAHFNLMFQNYLSDTKQFYGAMVQAVRNLQQPPAVSPMGSAVLSPATKTNPTSHNPLLLPDYTTLSPAGSAEPASSTGSEVPVYSNGYMKRPPPFSH